MMKSRFPVILVLLFLAFLTTIRMSGADIYDEGQAQTYCDTTTLHRIEGIWEFPDDQTRVLIRRQPVGNTYDLIVVASPDCRMVPGEILGTVRPSAEPGTYEMSIARKKVRGVFTDPGKCVARLTDNESSLTFKPRKLSLNIGSFYLLPRFWRMFRFKVNDVDIPKGMVRVYPVPYGSKSLEPVYL